MATDPDNPGIVKNIFTGYFILILHVLLLVLLGLFIIFFRGLVQYMPWILGGGLVLIVSTLIWLFVKFRRQRNQVQHMRSQGRGIEISLLGGLASMRVGGTGHEGWRADAPLQLEDPNTSRMRSLEHLMEMYNKQLISREEFLRLKQEVLLEDSDPSGTGADSDCQEATIVDLNHERR
jgi:membrane protein implicated in regulation of membrane protease activity